MDIGCLAGLMPLPLPSHLLCYSCVPFLPDISGESLLRGLEQLVQKQSKGVFQMECEVTSSPAPAYGGGSRNGMATNGSGVSGTPSPSGRSSSSPGSGGKSHLHVGFMDNGEVKEKREKYLTAKYGSHQMSLIRKRLSVEMWLYDELQKLYEDPESTPPPPWRLLFTDSKLNIHNL
ncbi:hypothetical protein Ocin01_02360 [Orchesella cincta]|uniref:Protein phosphatase 1 regulatory subunit 14B n=1 Tax=Orchesella cincta TaxID=48709 RepID=A0A1D2NGD3_ORCCI|nr:hypothetical protein Ocin01_02360 [Orchesella cincta]